MLLNCWSFYMPTPGNSQAFIGQGRNPNPHVLDIPEGLGAALTLNDAARKNFEGLNDGQKNSLIQYVQGGVSGDDAKARIQRAIHCLEKGATP